MAEKFKFSEAYNTISACLCAKNVYSLYTSVSKKMPNYKISEYKKTQIVTHAIRIFKNLNVEYLNECKQALSNLITFITMFLVLTMSLDEIKMYGPKILKEIQKKLLTWTNPENGKEYIQVQFDDFNINIEEVAKKFLLDIYCDNTTLSNIFYCCSDSDKYFQSTVSNYISQQPNVPENFDLQILEDDKIEIDMDTESQIYNEKNEDENLILNSDIIEEFCLYVSQNEKQFIRAVEEEYKVEARNFFFVEEIVNQLWPNVVRLLNSFKMEEVFQKYDIG